MAGAFGQAQYPAGYYPYPPPGFPGYPSFPPYTSIGGQVAEEVGDGTDAWKAAHNILRAINFGGLTHPPTRDQQTPSTAQPPPNTTTAVGHPQPARLAATPSTMVSGRVELQVHLALLAAQLLEIAQANEGSSVPGERPAVEPQQDDGGDGDGDDGDADMDIVEVPVSGGAEK